MRLRVGKGFSLVELLIVISIMAVLAGMLLPAVSLVRSSARATRCAGNLRQIFIAAGSYANDSDGFLCPAFSYWDGGALGRSNWTGLLEPYLMNDSGVGAFVSPAVQLPVALCPDSPKRFGYGLNYYGCADSSAAWKALPLASISGASELVYFVENVFTDVGMAMMNPSGSVGDVLSYRAWVRHGSWVAPEVTILFNHRNRAMVVWVDGHVGSRGKNDGFVGVPSALSLYWKH